MSANGGGAGGGEPRRAPSADLCSGLLFAALGALILWAGADYALGTGSRIGPGYVPRLLGLLLAGIGLVLVVRSRWTSEAIDATAAWRPLVLIVTAPSLSRWCSSSPAWCRQFWRRSPSPIAQRPRIAGPPRWHWARSSPSSPGCCSSRAWGCPYRSGRGDGRRGRSHPKPGVRLQRRGDAAEPAVLPDRRPARHAGRRAAGTGPGRHHRHAAARHLHAAAGSCSHHAGRALLRCPIRRLHHRDPGQHPRRILLRRHHARRPRHGPQGPRRLRARRGSARARSSPAAWRPPSSPCSPSRWSR